MDSSFSFRYIKLGVALVFLLISSILPGMGQYFLIGMGGIALMTAFASFGNYDYRGIPTKIGYKIGRYIGAFLIILTAIVQIYVAIVFPNEVHFTGYAVVIDVAMVTYLLFFKPSATTMVKKVLKSVGYVIIFIGINALQSTRRIVNHLTYSASEVEWGNVMLCLILMLIGTATLMCGSRRTL